VYIFFTIYITPAAHLGNYHVMLPPPSADGEPGLFINGFSTSLAGMILKILSYFRICQKNTILLGPFNNKFFEESNNVETAQRHLDTIFI